MTERSAQAGSATALPAATGDGLPAQDANASQAASAPGLMPQQPRRARWTRKRLVVALAVVLPVLFFLGNQWIERIFNTVSTDDAFVNGHVTFVAPRVAGQISRVLVDDNNRVHKGDLIAKLDKEPYEVAVSEKRAAVDIATANLQAAIA